jgi:uncharacterized protein YlxW (UPF0749 family)
MTPPSFPPKFQAQRDLEKENEKLRDKVFRLKDERRRLKRKLRKLRRAAVSNSVDAVSSRSIEHDAT